MRSFALSRNFLMKRAEVASERTRSRIDGMLATIRAMPGVGSSLVTDSIRCRYGHDVLKAIVAPYLIIYRYDRPRDTVYVFDLLDARLVR